MDKLTRINNLDEDMRKNRSEKTKVTEQIEELKSKSQDLDAHYLEMQNSKRMLGKEQYKDKKLRKKIVNYSKNSDFPETAIKLNQSKQTGKTGPDTADRLFNLIKKRY